MPAAERFEIAVPQAELDDLAVRLDRARLPEPLDGDTWTQGTSVSYVRSLIDDWREGYDWRAHEAAMNAHAHYRVELGGQTIHYLHVPRDGALPLLLLSGWPSTFWDFADVIPLLGEFELVIPDLPGYGFSTPLAASAPGFLETADLFHALMTEVLGHERYGVHGGDWGALVAEQMAHTRPEAVTGLHLSMPFPLDFVPPARELWTPEEAPFAEITAAWAQRGMAYFQMHVSRPQTVAFLEDSPVATAAWIVEKLHAWTDHDGDLERAYPRERALTTLSLYHLTRTFGSAAAFYASGLRAPWKPAREGSPVITVPTGIAAFPKENSQVPRRWAESYFNLTRYERMERGGHFPAIEAPELLAGELSSFFGELGG